MNRKSFLMSVLAAIGFTVAASAQTHTVYITGSTAFRSTVFNACTTSTQIFSPAATVLPAGATGSNNDIIYVGNINGVPYKVVCGWTGSEAGIACVAGRPSLPNVKVPAMWNGNAAQTTGGTGPLDPFQVLPGVPRIFLDPNGTGTTFEGSARAGDIAFSDTSRAASLTSDPSLTHEYGAICVCPFVWEKGFNGLPNQAWNNVTNITIPQQIYAFANPVPVSFLSGDPADSTDVVLLIGRNKGSGTRANYLLNSGTFPTAPSQWAAFSKYNGTSPNLVLTFTGTAHALVSTAVGSDQPGNTPSGDGFESGSGVAGVLGLDWRSVGAVPIGFVGLGDAATAEGNGAVRLTLNGVRYNAGAVASGAYSAYGYEHLYGQASPSADANTVAAKIGTGMDGFLVATYSATSSTVGGVPLSKMTANRPGNSDFGYPTP